MGHMKDNHGAANAHFLLRGVIYCVYNIEKAFSKQYIFLRSPHDLFALHACSAYKRANLPRKSKICI